jgi:hypothetical protein
VAVSASAASASASAQPATVFGPRNASSDTPTRSTNSARSAHRHAEQNPLEPGAPGTGGNLLEPVLAAVRGIEPPADPALDDPVLDPGDVVIVEAKALSDGLAAGEIKHLRGGQSLLGQVDQLRDHAEHRIRLSQRAVRQPDPEVNAAKIFGWDIGRVVSLEQRAERGLDQRRERLDVGAQHDHVARLERLVAGEQMQDRLAQYLHLARRSMAGVDLDASISRVQRQPAFRLAGEGNPRWLAVGADVGLDPPQERVLAYVLEPVMVVGEGAGRLEHQLELARVNSPRGEQAVGGELRGVVLGAGRDRTPLGPVGDRLPEHRRGMQHEQMDIAPGGDRG